MPTTKFGNRKFDARPDRVDLRDRSYQPKLISLPHRFPSQENIEVHLPQYSKAMILNQKKEGSCTGFGLAAVVNYLQWKKNGYSSAGLHTVSPRMLYHMV